MGMLRVDPDTGDLRDAMAAFFPSSELKWLFISNIQLRSSHELTLFISLFPQLSRLEMLQVSAPFIPETLLPLPEPPHDACEDLPPTGEMGTHLRMLVVNFLNSPQYLTGLVLKRLLSPPFRVRLSHIEWMMCDEEFRDDVVDESILLMDTLRASELTLESLKVSLSDDGELP